MGASVDEVVAYQTIQGTPQADQLVPALEEKRVDMVTFTSSSTVQNFHALLASHDTGQLMDNVRIACIGPITAETVRQLGFGCDVVADEFTIDGLCRAIVHYYQPG